MAVQPRVSATGLTRGTCSWSTWTCLAATTGSTSTITTTTTPCAAPRACTFSSVGAFRVIPANDLRDTFDKPLDARHGELWHLREAGLVQTVRIDRDTTVVTLTREGRDLLESRRWDREPDAPGRDRQAFHDGIQRPRELMHDAELYRAYLQEAERLHEAGAEIVAS